MIYVDDKKVEFFQFPDSQWHFSLDKTLENYKSFLSAQVTASLTSFEEIIKLLLVCDTLNRLDIRFQLNITYLIGSRMDRQNSIHEPFTLKIIMDLLNSIKCEHLCIVEPHSEVTNLLSNKNITVIGWEKVLAHEEHDDNEEFKKLASECLLVAPDQGMAKKMKRFCSEFNNYNFITAYKERDLGSGKIQSYRLLCERERIKGRECLVIDDLCDGGATFIGLAHLLELNGASKIYLAVCHGIFSKGFDELLKHYSHIWTTNSYREIASADRVTCINILPKEETDE